MCHQLDRVAIFILRFLWFCEAWIYDNNSYDVSKSNSHMIRRAVALSICQRIPTWDQCSYQFVARSLVRKIIHISLFWNSIRFHATRKKAVLSNDTRWKLILLHFISFILLQKMRWFMIQYNWIRRIKILCLQIKWHIKIANQLNASTYIDICFFFFLFSFIR